eukprot:Hpha_TRINITY_DN8358_c0_g1::TRINITY_DN8358_c0_g1_i1::g.154299::m.154299
MPSKQNLFTLCVIVVTSAVLATLLRTLVPLEADTEFARSQAHHPESPEPSPSPPQGVAKGTSEPTSPLPPPPPPADRVAPDDPPQLPDPLWAGGLKNPAWPSSVARPAPPAEADSGGEEADTKWKGAPWPRKGAESESDLYPAGAYYFYDDIANHSVLLMQRSLEIVEPDLPQHSLYVSPDMKSFGWSYPVKMNFIINAIKKNWGKVIVILDTDLVFYRPWRHLIMPVMAKNDIAFQGVDSYDPSNSRELSRMRKSITIAVVAIKCNARSQKLFQMVLDRISCNGRWVKGKIDQDELVSAVTAAAAQGMRWSILPRHFWGPAMSRARCKMPALPVMCHPDKKKGEQGGQWHPWHRKTEWKFHHIISRDFHADDATVVSAGCQSLGVRVLQISAGRLGTLRPSGHFASPRADCSITIRQRVAHLAPRCRCSSPPPPREHHCVHPVYSHGVRPFLERPHCPHLRRLSHRVLGR